jgi:uncharacterized protein YbbC (DUF1343 family)
MYSLRFHIRSHLEQRHGHQSTTFTSLFYKNFVGKLYMYILMKVFFQDKSIYMIFIFKLNNLKVVHDLYSQCLTQTLSKTTSNREPGEYQLKHLSSSSEQATGPRVVLSLFSISLPTLQSSLCYPLQC